jgi:predicted Zn finger-like uncharacterized protein
MIIECAECQSKFSLDEGLLKQGGSKVRCSICKHVFTAYPPEPSLADEPLSDQAARNDLEETVALDSPPVFEEREQALAQESPDEDFEQAFKEAMDKETVAMSVDQIPEEKEAPHDLKEAIGRASQIEEQVSREDIQKKAAVKPGEIEEAEEAPVPKKQARRSRFLPIVLGIIVLLLAGGVGVYFLAPDLLPESLSFLKPAKKQDVADAGVSRLSFKDVKGTFVQSEKAGQLFLIQGMVTNNYPKGRSYILIKASLLDDKGKVVKTKMAYAGNNFTEDQIKAMSLEEINKGLKNRLGKANANANIKPGGGVPFAVVMEEFPDNLSEFTVEAVSSSPAEQ